VAINYGTSDQTNLDYITVKQAKDYMEQGQFEAGTMLPKIQAAVEYIGDSAVRKALITKLSADKVSLGGEMGTMIGK
jgi:carbamate kinase